MKKSSGSRSRKQRLTAEGTRCADHVTPLYPRKLALTSPTGGGRSVGIVRVRTKATEFSFSFRTAIWWGLNLQVTVTNDGKGETYEEELLQAESEHDGKAEQEGQTLQIRE